MLGPNYSPEDIFWRQGGEAWFFYCWLPYWKSLSDEQKQQYLERWNVPEAWRSRSVYINTDLKEIFDECDSDIIKFLCNYQD